MNKHLTFKAIENNEFDLFKEYLNDEKCPPFRELYAESAKHNRINFISCMLEKKPYEEPNPLDDLDDRFWGMPDNRFWDELTPVMAAKNGHLECLKYCIENGCPWDELTPAFAASNGHLDCLKYTSEKIGFFAVVHSARNKQMECFMYCFKVYKDKQKFWSIPFNLIEGGEQYETTPKRRYSI